MIAITEMMKPAIWQRWEDAYSVATMIRRNTSCAVIVSGDDEGFVVVTYLMDNIMHSNVVTMGLVSALMARHDLPPDNHEERKFYGPRFEKLPYFREGMPKERPVPLPTPPLF